MKKQGNPGSSESRGRGLMRLPAAEMHAVSRDAGAGNPEDPKNYQ